MHGTSQISVYESASTKQFLAGRTEAIRSVTDEGVAFIRAFAEGGDVEVLRRLLAAATAKHRERATEASNGRAVSAERETKRKCTLPIVWTNL
jgi:carnitine O-acetyltransferase